MTTSPDGRSTPRVPNFKRFLITGALLGFLVGAVISLRGDDVSGYSDTTGVLFLGALGALLGAGLAGILGILLERSARERSGHGRRSGHDRS